MSPGLADAGGPLCCSIFRVLAPTPESQINLASRVMPTFRTFETGQFFSASPANRAKVAWSIFGSCARIILQVVSPHAGCLSTLESTGILRRRFPVAAKIALPMAGTIADVPVSPIPPGGSELLTMPSETTA
jgi:hypothetical protein